MKYLKICHNSKNYSSKAKLMYKFKVATAIETVDKILTGMSICRYGDGEFDIMLGKDIPFQKQNKQLAHRLLQIIRQTDNSRVLVAVSKGINGDYSNFNAFATNWWKNYRRENVVKIGKIIDAKRKYYSTQISRFYIDLEDKSECTEYIKHLRKIWQDKDLLIVEGAQTRMGIGNDLFNNSNSIKRIICPIKNAYEKYNEILSSCLEFSKHYTILIALGPTATVLAYDLTNYGYQALDIGHIDIEYEWYLKKAMKKILVENKYVNEAGGYSGDEQFNDIAYSNSIVKTISFDDKK